MVHMPGIKLGIFEGRGPIHGKGHMKTFKKEDTACEYCFSDSQVEKILWEVY